ncbi:hypothetical protein S1361_01025 [Streptomyces cyanogenus]|uniref:Uncharacterized protein n=1 Tax=Streptomyces cyanogenus TaxID=80860 RepID=A0ABX7THN9_STRCY|nr:hypothetical protein S1361_01025 [Streptomyces cyanogenus]
MATVSSAVRIRPRSGGRPSSADRASSHWTTSPLGTSPGYTVKRMMLAGSLLTRSATLVRLRA